MTREEAIKVLRTESIELGGSAPGVCRFLEALDMAVKALDAVPVVRCRECKHWKPTGSKAGNSFSDMEYIGGCEFTNYCRRESDFCSYGERKEGADNDT